MRYARLSTVLHVWARRYTTRAAEATVGEAPGGHSAPIEAHAKVWLERNGEVVISEFRAALLHAIIEEGSVAAAAVRLRLPYRTAWKKLREMDTAAGIALLDSGSGGTRGGGSELTAAAPELLSAFERLNGPVSELLEAEFDREGPSIAASLAETADRYAPQVRDTELASPGR